MIGSRGSLALSAILVGCSSASPPDAGSEERDASVEAVDSGPDAAPDASAPPRDPLLVTTAAGVVRGRRDRDAYAWQGIPFAAPPVGERRWRSPEPVEPWDGVLDTDAFGPKCIQVAAPDTIEGSEDCLTLNVWAPAAPADGSLPVMFFVHGGDNVWGSTSDTGFESDVGYDGAWLAARAGAIVVTAQYRLAAFGFFAHPAFADENDEHSSGNYATLDQIAALRWVQDNVTAFGGDPERVMLFGHSAGSVDTCTLVASPLAAGLFTAALMQSGACYVATSEGTRSTVEQMERAFGCEDAEDIAACLRSQPAERMADAPGSSLWRMEDVDWSHVVDGWVLPAHPETMFRNGEHNHVPLVFGTTTDEYSMIIDLMADTPLETEEQYRDWIAGLGPFLGAFVGREYPPDEYESPRDAILAFLGDYLMHCPVRRLARAAAASQDEPVWRYLYAFRFEREPYAQYGAAHGFEVALLWEENLPINDRERAMADTILSIWSGFAATSDPTVAGRFPWLEYDPSTDPYLVIDDTISAAEGWRNDACDRLDAALQPR